MVSTCGAFTAAAPVLQPLGSGKSNPASPKAQQNKINKLIKYDTKKHKQLKGKDNSNSLTILKLLGFREYYQETEETVYRNGRKFCLSRYDSKTRLVSRIKTDLQLNNKKTNNSIKNMANKNKKILEKKKMSKVFE